MIKPLKYFHLKKAIIFFAIMLPLAACENNLQKIQELDKKQANIEIAKNIRLLYSQAGKVKAQLTAPVLYRYLDDPPHVLLNNGLRVLFYNDSMQVQSILTAREGIYEENTNKITVKNNVVLINNKGEKLECAELHWDPQKQQFYTNTDVKITTPGQLIYGTGLVAPADFSSYTVTHIHNSNIKVNNNELP